MFLKHVANSPTLFFPTAALVLSILFVRPSPAASDDRPPKGRSDNSAAFDALLESLQISTGRDLLKLLERLGEQARRLALTNEQIDRVLNDLKRIETMDSYQEKQWRGKGAHDDAHARWVYVNRNAAATAIEVLGYRKIANDLALLPLETRVGKLIALTEGRAPVPLGRRTDAAQWFRGELWRMGSEAIPFILRRAEEAPEHQLLYVRLLSAIGDPRGIDFVLRVLRETPADDVNRRCDIIGGLYVFHDQRVIDSLVVQMHDETRNLGTACPMQQPGLNGKPRPIWYFPIRERAAEALQRLTQNRWPPLFSDDPKSWLLWSAATDREAFDLAAVPRTDEELASLIEDFTYRRMADYMRCGGWYESPQSWDVAKSHANDLAKLGPRVAPILVNTYRSIATEFPVWEDELRCWTKRLLLAVDTPESLAAASALQD